MSRYANVVKAVCSECGVTATVSRAEIGPSGTFTCEQCIQKRTPGPVDPGVVTARPDRRRAALEFPASHITSLQSTDDPMVPGNVKRYLTIQSRVSSTPIVVPITGEMLDTLVKAGYQEPVPFKLTLVLEPE